MKKILVLVTFMVFLMAGAVSADALQQLYLGGNYTQNIPSLLNGSSTITSEGGGSIDPSTLNGVALSYIYCVDVFKSVGVPGSYNDTEVNNSGFIYGNALNNAAQVAWLLGTYGTAGQGNTQAALQAAIWHVVFGVNYELSATASYFNTYQYMLTALDGNTGNVGDFLWITPGIKDSNGDIVAYQGLVARVPEPGTLLLIGVGLLGLAGFRKKK